MSAHSTRAVLSAIAAGAPLERALALGALDPDRRVATAFRGAPATPQSIERLPFRPAFVGVLLGRGDPARRAETAELALDALRRPAFGRLFAAVRDPVWYIPIAAGIGSGMAAIMRIFVVPVFEKIRPGAFDHRSLEIATMLFTAVFAVGLLFVLQRTFLVSAVARRIFAAAGLRTFARACDSPRLRAMDARALYWIAAAVSAGLDPVEAMRALSLAGLLSDAYATDLREGASWEDALAHWHRRAAVMTRAPRPVAGEALERGIARGARLIRIDADSRGQPIGALLAGTVLLVAAAYALVSPMYRALFSLAESVR